MALVTPLSADHDDTTKELAAFFNETLGFCPNSVLTMQRRPAISQAFINLNKAVMANDGRVSSSLKRMIAWVSSNATGCRYCQAHAIRAAERYGAEKERLYTYWDEGEIVEMLGVISLFGYLNRWNDSMGTTIEEGAVQSGKQHLGKHGWEEGKHL